MASAPFSTAARAHSQSPAGASSSGRAKAAGATVREAEGDWEVADMGWGQGGELGGVVERRKKRVPDGARSCKVGGLLHELRL